jgi:hypothetical protein
MKIIPGPTGSGSTTLSLNKKDLFVGGRYRIVVFLRINKLIVYAAIGNYVIDRTAEK